MSAPISSARSRRHPGGRSANPAVIADNVGDNVGDCAGMAADLFETYAVTAVAVMLLGIGFEAEQLWLYPLALGGISIIASVIGTFFTRVGGGPNAIINALYRSVLVATVLSALGFIPVTMAYDGGDFSFWNLYGSALIGLAVTFLLVAITEFYTGTRWNPVKQIAKASQTGHATNIEGAGRDAGVACLPWEVVIASSIVGAYCTPPAIRCPRIGVAVMAQLSMTGLFIVSRRVRSGDGQRRRHRGDGRPSRSSRDHRPVGRELSNTTKAVTKGYAIGSAMLGAHPVRRVRAAASRRSSRSRSTSGSVGRIGLFVGGLMPFCSRRSRCEAVGRVGGQVVEVRRRFRGPRDHGGQALQADCSRSISIVTGSAIREMMLPAAIPVAIPIVVGISARMLGGS